MKIINFIMTLQLKTALSEERLNNVKEHVLKNRLLHSRKFQFKHESTLRFQHGALSPLFANSSQSVLEETNKSLTNDVKFNRVNCLVWTLHVSARSFSAAAKDLALEGTRPALAMAWIGIDVHAWHKNIAYQVAVYALLMAVAEVELFLSHNRSNNNPSPVLNIKSAKHEEPEASGMVQDGGASTNICLFHEFVQEMDYGIRREHKEFSGVAGTVMAMTCCAGIRKLGSEKLSCCIFSDSIAEALFQLMDATHSLVTLDKLHSLATEAGFEEDFLSYFGSRFLPHKNVEDVEFWICLVHRKLCAAFHRESVASKTRILTNEVGENSLATLALFAYLGRETRLFLSRHGIRVLDKQTRDFVSYLECGVLFVYPEFSTLSEYQLLMEVILDEIGWLNFYAASNNQLHQERRRSKHPPIQAEKEIILHAVFTVCYDVILGYAHRSNSKHQALGADLLDFLLRSQALLSTCLEDYWVAYDGTIEMLKIVEKNDPDMMPPVWMNGTKSSSAVDTRYRPAEINKIEKHSQNQAISSSSSFQGENEAFLTSWHTSKQKAFQRNFLKKYTRDLVAASIDVWMGTQLLFVDISYTMRLVQKRLHGHRVTQRERKKIYRTTSDMFTLIPVAILMLLPMKGVVLFDQVSAVGHAAMFAAIKKYMPNLIPSPYLDERLDLVKQLKRIKKMKVRLIGIEDIKHLPNLN
ncbi:hypothetical protein SASPL_120501 [Salvia splendens]|uniref:LETM1-like protein n=1 Tax=Salvia splendens TaxID=180675 RepID=A0A8X8XQY0_SALSN|nr:hypothetical protein SASPL_120501 [Salvia splendens]